MLPPEADDILRATRVEGLATELAGVASRDDRVSRRTRQTHNLRVHVMSEKAAARVQQRLSHVRSNNTDNNIKFYSAHTPENQINATYNNNMHKNIHVL